MRHLYIHIPFCASRCGYCDFFSTAGKMELAPAYMDALMVELGECRGAIELDTVYVGGGTPTVLGVELIERLLSEVQSRCRPGAELTVEANPSTMTPGMAAMLAGAGVNRVSLGAQSFNPGLRRNLGRSGPASSIGEAVAMLRQAGIGNIGLDLMFSIPGQTEADLTEDLDQALGLEPEHISCYELTVKPGSDYELRWQRQLEQQAERGAAFYELVAGRLEAAGYRWYETSNFALPGRECRHNLAYWDGRDFLGIGAGAWSSIGSRRWRNAEDIEAYIEAAHGHDFEGLRRREELEPGQRLAERLLLGLRRDTGVERSLIAEAVDGAQEKLLLVNGYLVNEGGRISLTRRGRFVANEVCARLLRD